MHPGKTLAQALAETPAAALIARCERAELAARVIAAALGESPIRPGPPPTIHCQIREHVLLVFASSVAQAAKLRQAVPRLLAELHERGMNLSEIRVRVQPGYPVEPNSGGRATRKAEPRQPLSAKGALLLADKLALTLRPSPLRDAVERLARRLRSSR